MTTQRLQKLQLWSSWEVELRGAESELHQKLHGKVALVRAGKKLLLLEKLANSIEWPDTHIHDELRDGLRLTGYAPPCASSRLMCGQLLLEKISDARCEVLEAAAIGESFFTFASR